MRFIVFGAGGIGGVIGGRLFEHDHDVVLIARGAHHAAIARHGLRLESPAATVTLSIPVVGSPSELTFRPDDVVVLSTKSQDSAAALDALVASAPATVAIVCAQNGIENERLALRRFPDVYAMCVMLPATYLTPGVVQAHSSPVTGLLDLGRWPAGVDERAFAVAEALESSTFRSEVRPDIGRWKWGKLLMNLGNALEALCGPSGRSSELYRRARAEAIECLDLAGIAYVDTDEDSTRRGTLISAHAIGGVERGGGSTWQSLTRATGSIETDYLNGEVVLLGRLYGLLTPVNHLLQRLMAQVARDHRAPGAFTEEQLLALVDAERSA